MEIIPPLLISISIIGSVTNTKLVDMDTLAILKSLRLEEKVKLLSGTPDDFVSMAGIPERGLLPIKV